MILSPEQPFVDKAQRLSSWGHWFTFFNILMALLVCSSYIVTDAPPTTAIGYAYLVTNWLGHTAFITFILFVLTVFPLSLIFPYPRHIRGMGAILATTGMVLLAIDAYSYSRLGYHISGASLEQVFTLLTKTWNHHPLRSFFWVFGIVSAILAYELLISNYTWKRLERLREKAWGSMAAVVFLTAFVSSHLIHIWADAKFDYDVQKQNNMFPFSYPATAKTLLAKNGLLDKQQHQQTKADHLALRQNLDYVAKHQPLQCNIPAIDKNLVVLILSEQLAKDTASRLLEQGLVRFDKHYVPTNFEDSVFNLLYGLPSIYKDSIIANRQLPQWYQIARDNNLTIDIDVKNSEAFAPYGFITDNKSAGTADITIGFGEIENDKLLDYLNGLNNSHVVIVGKANTVETAIAKAPLWLKWSGVDRYKRQVTQNLGLNSTIIESWLDCKTARGERPEMFGKNLLNKQPKTLAANYTAGTIVSIKKDRIILLDDQGNDLQISASNGYKLNQPLDIPTLNDTINMLKRFSAGSGD